jgi:hypothetical protein
MEKRESGLYLHGVLWCPPGPRPGKGKYKNAASRGSGVVLCLMTK